MAEHFFTEAISRLQKFLPDTGAWLSSSELAEIHRSVGIERARNQVAGSGADSRASYPKRQLDGPECAEGRHLFRSVRQSQQEFLISRPEIPST